MNNTSDATPDIITNTMKKSCRFSILKPSNCVVFPASGYKALKTPASLLAAAFAKNQTAIISDANLNGASLFTNDKPMGDKQSSPQVCNAYILVSHKKLTFTPGATLVT